MTALQQFFNITFKLLRGSPPANIWNLSKSSLEINGEMCLDLLPEAGELIC